MVALLSVATVTSGFDGRLGTSKIGHFPIMSSTI